MVCIYAKKRNKRHASINLQELIDRYSSGEYIVQNFKFMKEEFLLSLNRNQTLILYKLNKIITLHFHAKTVNDNLPLLVYPSEETLNRQIDLLDA